MSYPTRDKNTKKLQNGYKKYSFLFLLVASISLAGFFVSSSAQAATGINKQINFQGKVVNTDGTNVTNGSYNFLFCIYTTSSPATACTSGADNSAIWRESKSITVTDGIFQTNLGDTTAFAALVDFNTDNIYLGINFNSNGQMSPLVRFTAAPYAMNAAKVGGLTVTDTTGTLTIPNGKTISFADAFTTSGAFPLTLTSTATTNATLPSGTITLADLATSQSLTNKTIGSTGLVFSGAATDITTTSGEDLTLVAGGAGVINLNDAVTISGTTTLSGLTAGGVVQATAGTGALTVGTLGASSITADSLDFTEFKNTMALDAALTLNQTTNTWTQSFTGTTTTGLSYTADALTSGKGLTVNSAATAFTGALEQITLSGSNAANTGNLLLVSDTGVLNTTTPFKVTAAGAATQVAALIENTGAGTSFRVNDATGDTTPFVVDAAGNIGIGTASPSTQLDMRGTGSSQFTVTNNWHTASSSGVWLNLSTDGPSGIGSGGAGTNPWIAYVNSSTNWFADSLTGDIAYRNTGGKLLFGNTGGNAAMTVSGNKVGFGDTTPAAALTVGNGDLFQVNSSGAIAASTGITSSGAIAANGGITFDDDTDTIGAHMLSGTVNANTNILQNIGNTGTDFIASTGALTLAGVLTANGGIAIGTQSLTGTTGIIDYSNFDVDATGNIMVAIAKGLDTNAAGALQFGKTNATSIDVCNSTNCDTINIGNLATTDADTIIIGDVLDTTSINSTGWSVTGAGALTMAGAIAANGGITFDATSDIVGSHTVGGTLFMNSNILQDIGNTGTDFIASTGALTLAGALTANGGINLSASQTLSAAALSFVNLSPITHSTTANQGLRLPNAASATPANPTSGEGYLAWDAAGNQLITYNGTAWTTLSGGGGYNLIKDETTDLTARTTLAFLGAGVSCADNAGQTECTISGGAGAGNDLGQSYAADADGSNATISLTSADDSVIISNPASAGTDSAFTFKVEQLNTSATNDTIWIDNRGIGSGLRIDDASGDTTPFVVDANGRVGIQTSTPTEALQVGSETNRANLSAYGDVTSEGYDIQRSLAGIIDIFVYDTTRDSDGGEWRNSILSQQFSWATETKDNTGANCAIATDDRCGNAVFPRKAIIATTADGLYIFDGADNTLWMKFTQVGAYALGADANNNPSGVGAQNGVIVVGTNGTAATGMYAFDFKQDTMFRYNATNRVMGDKNIGNRNAVVTYAADANTNLAISNAAVNDVSIALITSSTNGMANTLTLPTDSATSPVRGMTLIAVANDTAISVINMSTRRVLSYSDVTGDDYNQVVLTSRARLYATNETQGQLEEWRDIDREVVSELNGTPTRTYDELTPNGAAGKTPITTGTAPTMTTSPGSLAVIERSSSARESAATTLLETGDIVFVGTNQGLAEVHTSGGNLAGASWSKITTTTVATPYMVGAPRGVFLFDDAVGATSTASAVGTTGSTRQVLDTAGSVSPTFGSNGVRGTGVNFNNNSYLCSDANSDGTCDADTDFNAGLIGFTVSLWFKHSTTAAQDALFERCYTPATPSVAVGCIYAGMTTSGTIRFAIDSLTTWTYDTTYDDTIVSTATYNDNQWHHAVFTNTDTDICLYIDGKQAVACDTAIAATATMDASQVLTVGGVCSGANCTTGTNFWDGSIDDMVWSSNGNTTDNGVVAQSATKLYLDGRAHLIRPSDTVANATAFSSTTIGNSGKAYIPGSFVGLIVELTGGTGAGQTRTIISNDATTFTVYPAFATAPDATTSYRVSPAKLYGASNNVTAIAPDLPTNLNKIRKVYVGTDDGADGGGVSVFTNAGTGSIKTEVIHSDAGYATDNLGSTWSGTGADNITALSAYSDTVAVGSDIFQRAQRKEVSLKQLQLDTLGGFEDIRQELVSKQLFGSTQDVLGLGQGADLAERYYSNDLLEAGEIVAIDTAQESGIKRSSNAYQRDIIGVVSTAPGLVLGSEERVPYPVALVGRVPVKVTNENGQIYAGDRITASSKVGYGMFATQAGRVVGQALSDATDWATCEGENSDATDEKKLCTTVLVFVNLADYSGAPVELAMSRGDEEETDSQVIVGLTSDSSDEALTASSTTIRLASALPTREEKILSYLKKVRDEKAKSGATLSETSVDRLTASTEIITPTIFADKIFAKSIKADSIEGLKIFTDQIGSLEEKYAGLEATAQTGNVSSETSSIIKEQLAVAMKKLSVDSFVVQIDGSILGKLSVAGALRIGGDAEFSGDTVFSKLASFIGSTFFKGDVSFEKAPIFGSDTAGFAVIKKGEKKVRVSFDTAYEKQPIVAVSLTNDVSPLLDDETDKDLMADITLVEKDYLEKVFATDMKYIVTEKGRDGFTIVLNQKATADFQFSWVAIAVKKASTAVSESEDEEDKPESATEIPVEIPAETPPVTVPVTATPVTETATSITDSPVTEASDEASISETENVSPVVP